MTTLRHFVRVSGYRPAVLKPTTARQLSGIIAGIRRQYNVDALEAAFIELDTHTARTDLPHGTDGIIGGNDGLLSAFYQAYLYINTDTPVLSLSQFQEKYYAHGMTLLELMRRLVLNKLQYVDGYGHVPINTAYPLPNTITGQSTLYPCWSLSATLDRHAAGNIDQNASFGEYYYNQQLLENTALPHPILTLVGRLNLYQTNHVDQPILQFNNGADVLTLYKKKNFSDVLSVELISDLTTLEAAENILVSLLEEFSGGNEPSGISDYPTISNVLQPDIITQITQYLLTPTTPYNEETRQAIIETSYGTREDDLVDPTIHTARTVPILSHRPTSASLGNDGLFAATVDQESVSLYYFNGGALHCITSPAYGIANPFTHVHVGLPVERYLNGDGIYDIRAFAKKLTPEEIISVMTGFLR